jgi:hypothetical protein
MREDGLFLHVELPGQLPDEVGPVVDGKEETAVLEDVPAEGNRMSAKSLRKRSQKAEMKIAKELGGRVQKASGAMKGHKGDVLVKGKYRVEHKFTQAKQYTLTLADLFKIMGQCEGAEEPLFVVEFQERHTLRTLARYAIVPYETWMKEQDEQAGDDRGPDSA